MATALSTLHTATKTFKWLLRSKQMEVTLSHVAQRRFQRERITCTGRVMSGASMCWHDDIELHWMCKLLPPTNTWILYHCIQHLRPTSVCNIIILLFILSRPVLLRPFGKQTRRGEDIKLPHGCLGDCVSFFHYPAVAVVAMATYSASGVHLAKVSIFFVIYVSSLLLVSF